MLQFFFRYFHIFLFITFQELLNFLLQKIVFLYRQYSPLPFPPPSGMLMISPGIIVHYLEKDFGILVKNVKRLFSRIEDENTFVYCKPLPPPPPAPPPPPPLHKQRNSTPGD